MMEKEKHDFNEKDKECINGEYKEVIQTQKYKESKQKAIEMIDSGKYGLTDGDFWILMNATNNGKIMYSGLIISHNGCLKINDNIDNKINPRCFEIDKDGYNGSLVYTYIDDDTYETGEFSTTNGKKNAYPYAMAFKRCFDRVVLKKSKLAYAGIYSEVEAEEFKKNELEEETNKTYREQLIKYCNDKKLDVNEIAKEYKLTTKSTEEDYKKALINLKLKSGE